jgi:PhnB protein
MSTQTLTSDIRAVIENGLMRSAIRTPLACSHTTPLVHSSLAPPLRSTASNAEGLNAWFATWQGPIGYEIRDLGTMVGEMLPSAIA